MPMSHIAATKLTEDYGVQRRFASCAWLRSKHGYFDPRDHKVGPETLWRELVGVSEWHARPLTFALDCDWHCSVFHLWPSGAPITYPIEKTNGEW